ncbi:MAG: Trk family potassium uptake protein [Stomatobaculum sp.]|nr:Trk family potassium uptake protein [Stomatobaculum sp.]
MPQFQLPDRPGSRLSPFQIIILGFSGIILTGAFLLMLPFASNTGQQTSFSDALFTAVSAVCVTGLVICDTAVHWSLFGQAVILVLIQIGGLGIVTAAVSLAVLTGKRLSLKQRSTLQEAVSAPQVGGVAGFTKLILGVTFLTELAGALVMLPVFTKDFGTYGIWMSCFHSVSAFCNAGFDLMGRTGNLCSSLTSYVHHPAVNLAVMFLIVSGGIGFVTWEDIRTHWLRFNHYRPQSKIILSTTAFLILVPAVCFYFLEFSGIPAPERILASLFQSVTARTAGFNTVSLGDMSGAGQAVMIALMLIGGSPGSTAGGMKTTTFAVLWAGTRAVLRRDEDPQLFHRRIGAETMKHASALLTLYLILSLGGALVISRAESLPVSECLYETASALGTVGLSLGITPQLGLLSRSILMILMFLGRVGSLTFAYAAFSGAGMQFARLPQANITVG